ncbi:MAG: glycosyltransferase family 2 protein [Planctomycetes bacterium]|nr:glycosyltransferase family 2 protein [Planctomycetota bacterium]
MFRRIWNKIVEIRGLKASMLTLHGELQREIVNLHHLVDDFKSAQDVDARLLSEFHAWKNSTPFPKEPLVSVIVATWDRPELLVNRCVRSLLRQSYQNLEIIVVADASAESTVQAMAAVTDPRVKFFNLPQRGDYPKVPELRWLVAGTAPVNYGLSIARGDFITHLDDDDEHIENRIEVLLDHARQTSADVLWHPFWIHRPDREPTLVEARHFRYGQVTTGSIFYRHWLKQIPYSLEAAHLREPGDWNRFRKFQYLRASIERCPIPLLRHFK